jgi:hypothetical protein
MAAMQHEFLDRRVLAVLRFIDCTGFQVRTPVAVSADGATFVCKQPGEAVIMTAPGLASHSGAFKKPPSAPALETVTLQLEVKPAAVDLAARRFMIKLPRTAALAQAGSANSLFRPVDVELLPTPCAVPTGLVAALSVTVRRADDNRRIEGALVRLRPEGGRPKARAVADAAGDALLLIPGVPLSSPGPGATVLPDIASQLDVIVDPDLVRFTGDDELAHARATTRPGALIDPDDVESRLAATATPAATVRIACGQTRTAAVAWTPP